VQFNFRLREVFHEMVVVTAGLLQCVAAAVGTKRRPHVVMDRVFVGLGRLAKDAVVLAMGLGAAVGSFRRPLLGAGLGTIALATPLQLGFQLRDPRVALGKLPIPLLQLPP
jgi:hypothetical protein